MAQEYAASVKRYDTENGLSHREVNAIFQDKQGFMWFGTKFGLNRFDGLKFTAYTKERNGLDFDDIQSIAQDADGYLWLMGPYGQSQITLFDPLTGKAIPFAKRFHNHLPFSTQDTPQRLLSSANGTIFFTNYRPANLASYHPATGLRYVPLPQFRKLAVFQTTARNTVWAIADDNHLVELTAEGRVMREFQHQRASVTICFGQRNAGNEFFYFVNGATESPHSSFYSVDELGNRQAWPLSLLRSIPRYIFPVCYAFDRTGLIWDGTSLWHSTKGKVLDIAGQTSGESIENRSFYTDSNGWMWLGTSFGVYQVKVTENHFHRLFHDKTNTGEKVAAIRGITVLGDKVYANLERFGLFTSSQSGSGRNSLYELPTHASMTALSANRQGRLYIGLRDQLLRYDLRTGRHTADTLPNNASVWAFYQFSNEQLLAGGRMGLWLIQDKNGQLLPFTQYNQFPELAQTHVLHIAADREGTIWICAATGLYSFDPAKGITARYWSGGTGRFYLPADSYQHFHQDPRGIFWLATANSGLIRWDRRQNSYRQFRRTEGLANDNIYAVYPDWRGHLWMSSDYGIMQFDPVHLTTRAYFVQDGITHNEFNRIAHFQDQNGQIYFGGLNGITSFNPRDFQSEKPPVTLPLRIVSFRQFDNALDKLVDKTQELAKSNEIKIRPGDRTSVIDFALLNYANAEKNVYAYQFKGLDNQWTYQTEPSLRLSNLPYGDYQLLVKGQTADGRWSAATLAIQVRVLRPFYLSGWFLVTMLLLLLVGMWGWVRWRVWQHQIEQQRLHTQIRQATARIEHDKEIIEQQASVLQQLNETKSRFFANISHEFRTPLTVILGMAAELKRSTTGEAGQRLQRSADLIERNGSNLLRLINQILDLSKIEAGEMHLRLIRSDIASFIRYIAESFHSMAGTKDIQLHFLADEVICEADFDKDKLQDIISNLLTNAIKFTPAGGQIYFQLTTRDSWNPLSRQGYYEAVSPTKHLDRPWIHINVRDNGLGIEPDRLSQIFDRFFQAESPSEAGGTGIGLSLVKELVLLMNGGLAVRNLPGVGAEFIISLPRTRKAPLATDIAVSARLLVSPDRMDVPESAAGLSGDKPVLLLVEDNDDVATYIKTCIQSDYQVIRAENGQIGIDLALKKVPDLILSDVLMPQQNGFQLCDTLKKDQRTSHIPIVLLTAKAAISDKIRGLKHGADAYLVKPFQREELTTVLANLLQSRRILQLHFSQLALDTAQPVGVMTDPDVSLEDQFLHKLRSAIEGQLDNAHLSIEEICQLMGMGRTTLYMKMAALTGMSINRYVRSLRLRKARELLSSSSMNISEVAYSVGFEDPKYFSRVFSEEFGVSPGNFRHANTE